MFKGIFKIVSVIFLVLSFNGYTQQQNDTKVRRKTPEPGTKLSMLGTVITRKSNIALESNPDSVMLEMEPLTKLMTLECYKTIDTLTDKTGLPVRIYYPKAIKKEKPLPVLLFFHGGGFIWGSTRTYDALNHKLCRKTGCIIVFVEYRKAGETPFPAATDDCFETLQWVQTNIANLGGDTSRIGLIGDSAGGNLALVSAIKNKEQNGVPLSLAVLYYPNTTMVDTSIASRNYFMGREGPHYILSEELLFRIKDIYLSGFPDTSKYVSPLYADFSGTMSSSLVITASCDPLRDEGELLAVNLEKAGIRVESTRYPKMMHGFVTFFTILPKARKAIRQTADFTDRFL